MSAAVLAVAVSAVDYWLSEREPVDMLYVTWGLFEHPCGGTYTDLLVTDVQGPDA